MAQEFFDDDNSAHLFQLVHMLQRSAMMHMGLMQDNEGRVHYNLSETKAAIDTLSMLKIKNHHVIRIHLFQSSVHSQALC